MKFIYVILGILAFIFGVAMVIAAWSYLPMFAVAFLLLLFTCAILSGLTACFWLFAHARNTYLKGNTLVADSELGNYPVRLTKAGIIHIEAFNKPQFSRVTSYNNTAHTSQLPTVQPLPLLNEATQPLGLPIAPDYSAIVKGGFTPTIDKMILGVNHDGIIYGGIDELLSTCIVGRPGQGKSVFLRFVGIQIQSIGGLIGVLDPHSSIFDNHAVDTLFNASTSNEFAEAGKALIYELATRLAQYKAGKRSFKPFITLVDELPVVSYASKEAILAIKKIILEGRKVSMFALVSGQGLPADLFGGSFIRDAMSSRFIFQTTNATGRMAGLAKDDLKLLATLETGRCILETQKKDAQIVAIPFVTPNDFITVTGYPETESNQVSTNSKQYNHPKQTYNGSQSFTDPFESNHPVTAQYRVLPAVEDDLIRAIQAFKTGATSVRAMRASLQCSQARAIELLNIIRERYF